ncbi:MAG TPA: hypothetical protein VL181_00310 [Holophagaceae bacterium]|jgi:hypothetical protein|nr:hypothetical protein [Holophagaceae bacterium]
MPHEMKGWVPSGLRQEGDRVLCRWTCVADTPFTAPFFEETLQRCMSLPENSARHRVATDLDLLPHLAAGVPALEPAAFIFHVSRCGSTLVTQLLGEDPAFLTLSEVPFFDQLLRARFQPGPARSIPVDRLLPPALRLHGQARHGSERHLIVKTDCWHLGFHAELRALYPETPFILLYREPEAVIRSQRRRAGMHAIRGLIEPGVLGLDEAELAELPPDAYLPKVLDTCYRIMLRIARTDARSLLVPYEPDMTRAVETVARFAGIGLTAAHRERMRIRAGCHAKQPGLAFVEPEPAAIEVPGACRASHEALRAFPAVPT